MLNLLPSVALLASCSAPPPSAYVVTLFTYKVDAAGATAAAQTTAAKNGPNTAWRLWRKATYATNVRPTGVKATTVAALSALCAANPDLSIDAERQSGYVRETADGGGIVTVGDAAYPSSVRYVSVSSVIACESRSYADAVVAGVYSAGPLTLEQRYGLIATWQEPTPEISAIRARITPLAWGYLNAVRVDLPPVVSTAPPKELSLEPFDSAVTDR